MAAHISLASVDGSPTLVDRKVRQAMSLKWQTKEWSFAVSAWLDVALALWRDGGAALNDLIQALNAQLRPQLIAAGETSKISIAKSL